MSLEPEPEPEPIPAPLPPEPISLAASIKSIRIKKGLSQNKLAQRLGIPRTWASKVECGKTTPTLGSLVKLATALEVSVADLFDGVQRQRDDAIRELISQPFVASMLPFLPRLTELQRDGLIVHLRNLSMRQRRTA